jgi:DNA polymerase-3 subunit beta
VIERTQAMPVLANVLLSAREDRVSITGTDLEVELMAMSSVSGGAGGRILRVRWTPAPPPRVLNRN